MVKCNYSSKKKKKRLKKIYVTYMFITSKQPGSSSLLCHTSCKKQDKVFIEIWGMSVYASLIYDQSICNVVLFD